jgi:hypothetical protein
VRLLVYAKDGGEAAQRLAVEIGGLLPNGSEVWCRDMETLVQLLRTTRRADTIGMILTLDLPELKALLDIKNLFRDIPLVVILPDRNAETVAMGHSLSPRYLDFLDGDFREVAEILSKMIRNRKASDVSIETRTCSPRKRRKSDTGAGMEPSIGKKPVRFFGLG